MSETVTGLDLARLEELAKKATPGPWHSHGSDRARWITTGSDLGNIAASVHEPDAEFIVAFCNAVPSLLAAARTVRRVEALCDDYRANCDPTSKQAKVAALFRAALGTEQEGRD